MSDLPDKDEKLIREENNSMGRFSKIEKSGLNYIKSERKYLILSALVPIYIIIVQCINLVYIITAPPVNPLDPRPPANPIVVFTPIIILIVISFFALFNFGIEIESPAFFSGSYPKDFLEIEVQMKNISVFRIEQFFKTEVEDFIREFHSLEIQL